MAPDIDLSISEAAKVEEQHTSWKSVFERFTDEYINSVDKVNPSTLVPAKNLRDPDSVDAFSRSARSFKLGSSRVYRDDQDKCSIQVRVFPSGHPIPTAEQITYDQDMYYIQLNWHNPDDSVGALKHFIVDVLKIDIPQLKNNC